MQLNSDAVFTEKDVADVLGITSVATARMLINSVSESFRMYTGRLRINATDGLVERLRGDGTDLLWAHANVVSVSSIEVYSEDGSELVELVDTDDLWIDPAPASTAIVRTDGETFPRNSLVVVTYRGGWEELPGDVYSSCMAQVAAENQRLVSGGGIVKTHSDGAGGMLVLDNSTIIPPVAGTWDRYRVLV